MKIVWEGPGYVPTHYDILAEGQECRVAIYTLKA